MRRRYKALGVYVIGTMMKAVDKIDKKAALGYLGLLTEIQNFLIRVNYDGHPTC